MSEEPPVQRFSEALARRRELSLLRAPKLPQEYASIEDYHEACNVRRAPPRQTTANLGHSHMKRRS